MLNLFGRKEPSGKKIETFCRWFVLYCDELTEGIKSGDVERMRAGLDELERQLAFVYRDGYKGKIEFEYGFNEKIGRWELNLFHLDNRFLIKAATLIREALLPSVDGKWQINVSR